MKTRIRQNIPLIIGLAIPVLMILFVAGAIYIPRWFTTVEPPRHDFLYLAGQGSGDVQYWVRDGKLIQEKVEGPNRTSRPYGPPSEIKFFLHRVKTNRSEEVTFADAAKLRLDSKVTSPDGYSIVHGRRPTPFFPFFASWDYQTRYLKKNGHTEKLNLQVGEAYPYYYSFRFLGWVVE